MRMWWGLIVEGRSGPIIALPLAESIIRFYSHTHGIVGQRMLATSCLCVGPNFMAVS